MIRFTGIYHDPQGREQSLHINVTTKPQQKIVVPQEKTRIEKLVNIALEEYGKSKINQSYSIRTISKLEVTEENKVQLFAGSQLIDTLEVRADTQSVNAFHPQVKLKIPTPLHLGRALSRVDSRRPIHRLIEFFSWCAHLLFGPSGRKQFQKQKLFSLLFNHAFSKDVQQLHEMKASERIRAVQELVVQEGNGFGAAAKQIASSLTACGNYSKGWEDLLPRFKKVSEGLMMTQHARHPRGIALRKKYEMELQKIKKAGESLLSREWKSISSISNGKVVLIPIFLQNTLSDALMRISRHGDTYILQVIDTNNILNRGHATDRSIKKERSITYENLSLAELKTHFDLQYKDLFPIAEQNEQKTTKISDEWQKALAEGPLAAKRSAPSAFPEDYISLDKSHTMAKPLLAYLGTFDSGPELKRLKLRMRLAELSRFYSQVKHNLEDNETNYILLKDGMEKISRTISKLLADKILSPDEVNEIAPIMQRLQHKLVVIEKARNARWQMKLRDKSPASFSQLTLSEQAKLYNLPSNLQARTVQDILSLKSIWREPPSLEGLKSPQDATKSLSYCLEHAKALYEQKDYAKLLFHVNRVYLNLEIPQDPDAKDDFWQKIDSKQRNECSEMLGKMQVYLFESFVKQKLQPPFPPEIALGFTSLFAVFDRLTRLEDPCFNDYRFNDYNPLSHNISWTHLSHPEDRDRADKATQYFERCKAKTSIGLDDSVNFHSVSLGMIDNRGKKFKNLGDYLDERKQYLESKGNKIVLSKQVSELSLPVYNRLTPEEIALRRKRIDIATDLGEKNLLAKPIVHYHQSLVLSSTLMKRRAFFLGGLYTNSLERIYDNHKVASSLWDGQSPYLKQHTTAFLRTKTELTLILSSTSEPSEAPIGSSGFGQESDYSSFSPIRDELLRKGISSFSKSEPILAAHVVGKLDNNKPTRLSNIPEEASRDRFLIAATQWTKLEDCLGFYWENRYLLTDLQYQEDLRRILFSESADLKNRFHSHDFFDYHDSDKYQSGPTSSLALKNELKNPNFIPYLQDFFNHQCMLFENEQNYETAASLAYLAAQIQSHIAFWDSSNPNLKEDYEAYLHKLLDKVPANCLDVKRQIYGYLACLLLHRQSLTKQQESDLFKAQIIHTISETDSKAYHPLREHQVQRTLDKWAPTLRNRMLTDANFRDQVLSELISECYQIKLESKEWQGQFPLFSNGEFQIEADKGIVFRNDKANAYLPANIKANSIFLTCFPKDFSPLAEIIMTPPEKGQKQSLLCYQFSSEGKRYRAIVPKQGELILQREETIDGKTSWFQFTPHRDHQNFEDALNAQARRMMGFTISTPGIISIIGLVLSFLKKRLENFIPRAIVERNWWVNTQDRTQLLVMGKDRKLNFIAKLSSRKGIQTVETIRDLRPEKPSHYLQLLNVWKNKSTEWGIFRAFAHPQNTLVWGKNNVPEFVEFTEHDLQFRYDAQAKQWNCLKKGLEGFHISTTKNLPALGSIRNAIILENKLGEQKVLLAARPVFPGDPEESIPNSFGRFLKSIWRFLSGSLNNNLLNHPLCFNRTAPSELYVYSVNQMGSQMTIDHSNCKHGAAPNFYLAELYLRTHLFSQALEQIILAINKNGFNEKEQAALFSLFGYAKGKSSSDPRMNAFLLHLAKVVQESQNPQKPIPLPSVDVCYENYLREVGKGNIGNIPESLLLSSEDEKTLWRMTSSVTRQKTTKEETNPFYEVLQNRQKHLWPAVKGNGNPLAERKVRILSPKDNALAAKVHEVMHKKILNHQELAIKEVAQKLISFHKFRNEQIQKKLGFSELRKWLRSLPEDDYVETLRSYLETVIDLSNAEELPKEFQNLSAIEGQEASPDLIQKLLAGCAEVVQCLREQQPECCKAHLISSDADLAARRIQSNGTVEAEVKDPALSLNGVTTLFSPEDVDHFFKAEAADSEEDRKNIRSELKGILEHVADHNPNHTNISKQVCKDLLEDYDSFLESYDYKTYQWKSDPKTELASIEKMLGTKKDHLAEESSKLDQAIDEIINKTESIPGESLRQEFQKLGMGAKSISKQHLRHLFLQGKLEELTKFNSNLTPSDLLRLSELMTKYLIAETAIQQIVRAQGIMEAMKVFESNREELLPALVDALKARRIYDPWKHPEFLVMEYEADILFRKKQVEVIHEMIRDPNCIKQLIMGAGKTTVILPLIALLRADGKNLSIVISTQALYSAMKDLLLKQSKNLLNQDGFPFEWERYSLEETLNRTKGLYDRFLSAIENRQYILSTRESFQCLEATYVELLNHKNRSNGPKKQKIEQALSELKKVRKLLKEKGVVTADEVDKLMDPKEKTIFPTGLAEKYEEEELDIAFEIYNKLLELPKVGLRSNKQGNLTEKEQEEERYAVAKHFVTEDRALALITTEDAQKTFIKDHQDDFIEYLLSKKGESELPAISKFVETSPKENAIFTLRGGLSEILKTTLAATYSKDYIRSKKDSETTTPTEEKDIPREGSQFGHRIENLYYILQDYLHKGIAPEKLQVIIARLHQDAVTQEDKEKIHYENTAGAKTFASIFGESLINLKKSNTGTPPLADCQRLAHQLTQDEKKLFRFLREYLLNKPSLYAEVIEQNSQQFVSMFKAFGGFSGTLNAFIFHRCNKKTIDRARDAGTDTRTLFLLLRNNRRLIQEGHPNGILEFYKPENETEKITAADTPERVRHLLNKISQFDLFGDAGGIVQGCSDEKIIELLPQTSKAKAYYNQQGAVEVKTADGRAMPLKESDAARQQTVTWLPARYARGADIPQHYYAKGVFSTAKGMGLDELLQMVWRLRGLGEHQIAYLLVASWLEKHLPKTEKGALAFESILINAIKEKAISEAENNLRKAKDELEDIVRDIIRSKALSASPEEEDRLMKDYVQFFTTKIGNKSSIEFKYSDQKEDPLLQLQRLRDGLLAFCNANLQDLNEAAKILASEEYDYSLDANKAQFNARFADEVRAEASSTAKTQVRIQTEAEQQVQEKINVHRYAKEPMTHKKTLYPHLIDSTYYKQQLGDGIIDISSSVPKEIAKNLNKIKSALYVAKNLDEIEDALSGKLPINLYFQSSHYSVNLVPQPFIYSSKSKIHPAFSEKLTFTDNWLPLWTDQFAQECEVIYSNQDKKHIIKKKTLPDGSPVVAKPLKAFEHPLQQPIHIVKVKYDPRDNSWEVRLLCKEDQEGEKQLINEDLELKEKKKAPNSQVQVGLYDLRTDKFCIANTSELEQKLKLPLQERKELLRYIVEAKVLAGQLHYSADEKTIIHEWLKDYYDKNGAEGLEDLYDFVNHHVLDYHPSKAQVSHNSYFFKKARKLLNHMLS